MGGGTAFKRPGGLEAGQLVGRYRLSERRDGDDLAPGVERWLGHAAAGAREPVVIERPDVTGEAATWLLATMRPFLRLRHRHLAKLRDAGLFDGRPYLVYEPLEGRPLSATLAALIERGERMPLPLALPLVATLAEALARLHEAPAGDGAMAAHGAVMPALVFVDDEGVARLKPGLAPASAERLAYASPEQRRGAPAEARADVFALGVLAYELTTGRRLVSELALAPPSSLVAGYDGRLEALLGRVLEPQAERRLASASELAGALQAIGGPATAANAAALARWRVALDGEREWAAAPEPTRAARRRTAGGETTGATAMPAAGERGQAVRTTMPRAEDRAQAVRTTMPAVDERAQAVRTTMPAAGDRAQVVRTAIDAAGDRVQVVRTKVDADDDRALVRTTIDAADDRVQAARTKVDADDDGAQAGQTAMPEEPEEPTATGDEVGRYETGGYERLETLSHLRVDTVGHERVDDVQEEPTGHGGDDERFEDLPAVASGGWRELASERALPLPAPPGIEAHAALMRLDVDLGEVSAVAGNPLAAGREETHLRALPDEPTSAGAPSPLLAVATVRPARADDTPVLPVDAAARANTALVPAAAPSGERAARGDGTPLQRPSGARGEAQRPASARVEAQRPASDAQRLTSDARRSASDAQRLADEAQRPASMRIETQRPVSETQRPASEAQRPVSVRIEAQRANDAPRPASVRIEAQRGRDGQQIARGGDSEQVEKTGQTRRVATHKKSDRGDWSGPERRTKHIDPPSWLPQRRATDPQPRRQRLIRRAATVSALVTLAVVAGLGLRALRSPATASATPAVGSVAQLPQSSAPRLEPSAAPAAGANATSPASRAAAPASASTANLSTSNSAAANLSTSNSAAANLSTSNSAAANASTASVAVAGGAGDVAAVAVAPSRPLATGSMRVLTIPEGAALVIDGRKLPVRSPALLTGLRAGRVHVLAIALGSRGVTEHFRLEPDEAASLEIDLRKHARHKHAHAHRHGAR